MLSANLKHLDLREIAARCDTRTGQSARGKQYHQTEPGRADFAFVACVYVLKALWKDGPRVLRMAEIEDTTEIRVTPQADVRLAASLKRLERMGQVALDFDREGVMVKPGSKWIET